MNDQGDQLRKAVQAIKKLQSKLEEYQAKENEQVAVVGMACRLPAKSSDLTSYWNMLVKGENGIGPMPEDRWDTQQYFDKDPSVPGKYNTLYGNFLEDVKGFDNEFFSISASEAAEMDPHQRLLLTVMWEAIQNSYIPPTELIGKNVGVFVGMGSDKCDYMTKHAQQLDLVGPLTGVGNTLNGAAGRLSYVLNSQGPSEAIDTACCSSLVAVHHALQSLLLNECDYAVVGGVSLILSPLVNIICTKMGVLSADGHTRGFDRDCTGFGRGEGCGVIILRRLSDATRSGDKVLAVIRGAAANHNGMTMSITAPSQLAQEAVMKRALVKGRLEANDITYIEANATASKIGDSLELEAIKKVYGENRTSDCYLASAGSNFGHLDAATGIAGLIKVVLQLNHKKIVPQLDFKAWNENVNFSTTKFHVPTEVMEWKVDEGKSRTAGVSAFGWAGQNGHVILQEVMQDVPVTLREQGPYLLLVSAKSEAALIQLLESYEKYLPAHADELGTIVKLAANGRDHYKFRLAVLGNSVDELVELIKSGKSAPMSKTGAKVALQFKDVDYSLDPNLPYSEIAERIKQKSGVDILSESADLKVQMFRNFATRYLLASLWTSWIGKPDEVLSSQSSESGELAFFNDKAMDALLDELATKGKFIHPLKDKIGAVKFSAVDKLDSAVTVVAATVDSTQNAALKAILRDLYNAGRKINWANVYTGKGYSGILELPKHPFRNTSFWIS